MSRLVIRKTGVDDLEGLNGLYAQLHPSDPQLAPNDARKIFDHLMQLAGSAIFVGILEELVVSSCTLIVIPNLTRGGQPYGLIETVVTHPQHRGRGFGTEILQAAVDHAWDHNCYQTMLLTGAQDPHTLGFYARAGFEPSKSGFQQRP